MENGRIVKLEGNPEHVSTRGRLCAKGNSGMWYTYDPDRILYPLKRVGARGEGKWKRITWDEALTEVAEKLNAALKKDPNSISLKYGRNRSGGVIDRFMNTLGSATVINHTSVCESSKKIGMEPTWGPDIETPDFANAKYILNFGSNIMEAAYFHNPYSQRLTEGHGRKQGQAGDLRCASVQHGRTFGRMDPGVPGYRRCGGIGAGSCHPARRPAGHRLHRHLVQRVDGRAEEALQAVHAGVGIQTCPACRWKPSSVSRASSRTTKPATTYTYRGPAKHLYGSYNEKATMMLSIMTGNVEKRGGYCMPRGMGWPQPQPEPPKPAHGSVHGASDRVSAGRTQGEPSAAVLHCRRQAEDQRALLLSGQSGLHQSRVRKRTGASCTATRS